MASVFDCRFTSPLREVVCYQRGVHLHGDDSAHGETVSQCLRFIRQFLEGSFSETCTHTPAYYTVPWRRPAGLISKLSRRVLLGNLAFTLRAKKVVRQMLKHAGSREALPIL